VADPSSPWLMARQWPGDLGLICCDLTASPVPRASRSVLLRPGGVRTQEAEHNAPSYPGSVLHCLYKHLDTASLEEGGHDLEQR
jgi:hypothetical protein